MKEQVRSNSGLDIIGFLETDKKPGTKNRRRNIKVLGRLADISRLASEYSFRDVFIIDKKQKTDQLINIIEKLRMNDFFIHVNNENLRILQDINQFEVYGTEDKFIDISIRRYFYKKYFKLIFDYIFSILFLTVISPLLLVLSILIKTTSKGPVFFVGERIGIHRKKFRFYKFRSMKDDMHENIKIHKERVKSFYNSTRSGSMKEYASSDRTSKFGRFLRKFSLDELPQFANVLKGDMSIAGPRPCMDYEADYFTGWRKYRFDIKPGITGLWQAYGRSKVDFDRMSVLEYYYYSNCSFSLDLKILFDTIKVIILGIGGY
jgi:lipopolysaccharide/colanic/teichoic acid biosynthesis glycosyltransferase